MKHTPQPLIKYFKPLALWRDDLEKLIAILARQGGAVELVAGEYTFQDVGELVGKFGAIHHLSSLNIKGRLPYANIDLDRLQARVYVSAEGAGGSGVFFEARNVLTSAQRR